MIRWLLAHLGIICVLAAFTVVNFALFIPVPKRRRPSQRPAQPQHNSSGGNTP